MNVMFFYKQESENSAYQFSIMADGELYEVVLELPVHDKSQKQLNDKSWQELSDAEKSLLEEMIPACIEAAQSEYENPLMAELSWQAGVLIKTATHLHDDVYQCTDEAGNNLLVYSLKYGKSSADQAARQVEIIAPIERKDNVIEG